MPFSTGNKRPTKLIYRLYPLQKYELFLSAQTISVIILIKRKAIELNEYKNRHNISITTVFSRVGVSSLPFYQLLSTY